MSSQQPEYNNRTKPIVRCQSADRSTAVRGQVRRSKGRARLGTHAPFETVLQTVQAETIGALLNRASLANRLAKSVAGATARRTLYLQKAQALSRLIELGAAIVDECLVGRGLVTVALPNGRCLHVPIDRLSQAALSVVRSAVMEQLAASAEPGGRHEAIA